MTYSRSGSYLRCHFFSVVLSFDYFNDTFNVLFQFLSLNIIFMLAEGDLSLRGYARAVVFIRTRTRIFT